MYCRRNFQHSTFNFQLPYRAADQQTRCPTSARVIFMSPAPADSPIFGAEGADRTYTGPALQKTPAPSKARVWGTEAVHLHRPDSHPKAPPGLGLGGRRSMHGPERQIPRNTFRALDSSARINHANPPIREIRVQTIWKGLPVNQTQRRHTQPWIRAQRPATTQDNRSESRVRHATSIIDQGGASLDSRIAI